MRSVRVESPQKLHATGCELEYAEYVDCCIENTHFDEFGRLPTEMRDCSFDEEEWVAEQGMEMKL